jgi:hypothetical protein
LKAPHTREDRDKFAFDRLHTGNELEGVRLSPEEMIGRTVLMPPSDIGERFRATIKERIDKHNADCETHPEKVKFRCVVDGKYEEIVSYNQIIDFIEKDDNWDGVWKFREILSHKSKLTKKSKEYRGCGTSLHILWENGETTWELLKTHDKMGIFDHDPVTVALYAVKHNLIGQPGWSDPLLRKYAKTPKRIIRLANQAKLHSFRTAPRFMYGVQIPHNHVPNQIGGLSTCERKVLNRKTLRTLPALKFRKTTSCTPTCLRGRMTKDGLSIVHGTQDHHRYIPFSRSGSTPSQKGTIGLIQ